MENVAEEIKLQLIGSPDHSDVAIKAENPTDFRHAISLLVDNFEFTNFEVLTLVVEGDTIAFHWRANVRNPKNGKEGSTELMDIWTVKDGKASSMVQACDTAMAQ